MIDFLPDAKKVKDKKVKKYIRDLLLDEKEACTILMKEESTRELRGYRQKINKTLKQWQ